ncbi:MAG: hypothetical protein KDC53_07550 [Saprospiraceae bacterium]|nr:hypothetical protein [Saprospiraceae bacterium]
MKLLDVLYPTSLRIILLSSIHLLLVVQILAQDLGQLDAAHPVQLSGGMTINLGAYSAAGISGRRDPFSYLVLGRLNFNLFGVVDVPIGVSFTQQENGFSQPFNHYGMSPRYKWIQTHVGYRNLTWSPYTLNGHTFLGAGIDLDLPLNAGPKIRLSAMSGRLRRAVDTETALLEDEQPSYRRKGHGLNLQLTDRNNSKNFFTANVFAAKDDPFSIQDLSGYDLESARENVTIGLGGQVSLLDKLVLNGNYGFSALTRDAENEDVSEEKLPFLMELGKVFITPNQSTQFDEAFDVSAGWQIKTWSLKIKYQWIDPGYSSLGSYYFQNDFENITIDGATTLQGGKIRLRASLGQQRNNLEGDKMTRTKRLIGSLNYNHSLTDRMAINGSFSNYSSSLKVVQEELSDTLNYYQINTSINAGINYVVGSNADRSL